MATANLFLSHERAQHRAVLAADRIQAHGERLDALWTKIERLEGTREPSEKGWLTRYRSEFARIQKLERRALRDWEREVERENAYAREIRQRQRAAAIERRKAKVKPKAKPLEPRKPGKVPAAKKRKRPVSKRPSGGYEYVLKVKYRSPKHTSEARHHSVWWDVRLKKTSGGQAKPSELRMVVRHLKSHGEAPPGWEAVGIRWDRGARPTWDQLPAKDAETTGQDVSSVLASLSSTLVGGEHQVTDGGRDAYEIGEERIDDDVEGDDD